MDLGGGQEGEVEMPISSANHESSKPKMSSGGDDAASDHGQEIWTPTDQSMTIKKTVRYRECLKNHAVGIGGHAVDGCGEFMPSGDEGTLEALKCAACNCHRNFHRKETDGDQPPCHFCNNPRKDIGRKVPLNLPPGAGPLGLPSSPVNANVPRQHGQMIMALSNNNTHSHCPGHMQSEDRDHMGAFGQPGMLATMSMQQQQPAIVKKRFRTKFTQEQKDKMFAFAEKLGWRIQKPDDAAVQQFCIDVGVKRHVLKVWMHNNKHSNLGKKP